MLLIRKLNNLKKPKNLLKRLLRLKKKKAEHEKKIS
jgi:hypothetical protein